MSTRAREQGQEFVLHQMYDAASMWGSAERGF